MELSEYNIKLKNTPGRENRRADMLSRRPDYDQGEKDNQDVVVLPEEMFIRSGTLSYIPREPPQQDKGIVRQWAGTHDCYALTGRSSRREVSLSGVLFGLSALATCDADVW